VKLSCLPVSLYPDLSAGRITPGDWFRMAAALELDGADISVAHVASRSTNHLDALKREAADAGVTIAMLAAYTDFTHPSSHERARQVDDLRAWIAAAARLGTPIVRVTAGQAHPGVTEKDGLTWAASGLMACLDDAAAAGVRLLVENHVRGSVWTYHDFAQPAARFLEVARRTAHTSLGVLFDTANNLALGEDPVAVLGGVSDRVRAIHLSDLRCAGTFEPVRLGTGIAPLPALLRHIVASGFDGWISIEEASRSGADAFAAAVRAADRMWAAAGGAPRVRVRNRRS
jgi:sugar phosphate isomerase/epimerase